MKKSVELIKKKFSVLGNSKLLNHAIETAIQAAPTQLSIVITGESGAGKEFFSKIIHMYSKRKHKKCISINCGAMPEGTIDSELFGHEKGAFTGAYDSRKGYFEEADGGTLFLDEIGEMPLSTQVKLLRLLEQKEYLKVGSSKVLKCDVRIIAATNKNLKNLIKNGKFREDLYYRLNTVPIYVPALRERVEDIPLLFKYYSKKFSQDYHTKPIELSDDAMKILQNYSFPGNIRQLKNLANQISILNIEKYITSEVLLKYLPKESKNELSLFQNKNKSNDVNHEILFKSIYEIKQELALLKNLVFGLEKKKGTNGQILYQKPKLVSIQSNPNKSLNGALNDNLSIEENEKKLIKKALSKNNTNRKQAAKELGISERTLYRKIKYYNID